jgi:hypothetical protein
MNSVLFKSIKPFHFVRKASSNCESCKDEDRMLFFNDGRQAFISPGVANFKNPLSSNLADCATYSTNEEICFESYSSLRSSLLNPGQSRFAKFSVQRLTEENLNRLHVLQPSYRPFLTCYGPHAKKLANELDRMTEDSRRYSFE